MCCVYHKCCRSGLCFISQIYMNDSFPVHLICKINQKSGVTDCKFATYNMLLFLFFFFFFPIESPSALVFHIQLTCAWTGFCQESRRVWNFILLAGKKGRNEPPPSGEKKKLKESFALKTSKSRVFFTYVHRDRERKEEEGELIVDVYVTIT